MRTSSRRARALVAVSVATTLALLTVIVPVAAATPQQPVTIVSNVTFADPGEPNFGDFETSGSATDRGLVCESGTFVDTFLRFGGFQRDNGLVQVLVRKELTCDDDSGTFVVQLRITANFDTGIESFTWVVLGGTGDYAHLRGGGTGSTVPTDTGNINTYVGFLLH
jgi:hypothetical protein